MHIGIIFQGPLKSRGFDCAAVLLGYHQAVSTNQSAEITCCLSTSEDETIPETVKNLGWPIFLSPPVAGFDLYNRQKQIVSTLKGASQLTRLGRPDFLLKIRTDLQIDLNGLIEHIVALEKSGQLGSRMVFPAANPQLPFMLCDFFFGGRPEILVDFLQANLEFKDVCLRYMPEMDLPLKYFFCRYRAALAGLTDAEWFLNIFDYAYVRRNRITEIQSRLWREELLDRHFVLCPKPILENAIWRGRSLVDQYGMVAAIFFDDQSPDSARPFGVKCLPFRAMPVWSWIMQWCKGRLEFFRWRQARPMTGICLFTYKVLDKVNRLLVDIFLLRQ